MERLELLAGLACPADTKMVLLVLDGLGGLPEPSSGQTELEAASTPHLDALAARSELGLTLPVARGITPGSGPAHLSLFGYDPLQVQIGRGVLSGLGVDFPLTPRDLAVRLNFCTLDEAGLVEDRRAGRIPTELGVELCRLLQEGVDLPGVEVHVISEKEYRAVAVFRPRDEALTLEGALTDSDPQGVGLPALEVRPGPGASGPAAQVSADLMNRFARQARELLSGHRPANGILMRGFACRPSLPLFPELYQLKALAVAMYPMYRGLARLVGMEVLPPPASLAEEFQAVVDRWADHDFFFVHVKPTDSAGEDGDPARKRAVIEEVDRLLPKLLELDPGVLVVTGDHSTPTQLKGHSWHGVPYLIHSPSCRFQAGAAFGEGDCARGALGTFPAQESLALMLAHAGRLKKFGA